MQLVLMNIIVSWDVSLDRYMLLCTYFIGD